MKVSAMARNQTCVNEVWGQWKSHYSNAVYFFQEKICLNVFQEKIIINLKWEDISIKNASRIIFQKGSWFWNKYCIFSYKHHECLFQTIHWKWKWAYLKQCSIKEMQYSILVSFTSKHFYNLLPTINSSIYLPI